MSPVAFNRKESPGQLHTVHGVTKPPFSSAVIVHGKYDESADTVLHGCVRFFTFKTTLSYGAKPAPVNVAVDNGA